MTTDLHDRYERDGYAYPIRVLSDEQAQHYRARYHAYVDRNRERLAALPANQKYLVLSETHFAARWAYELVINPRILDAVEAVIGPNILAWGTNWFSKMPGDKAYVSWHQDGTYWNLAPVKVVTAWLALTPSNETNGGLRVVPGTHHQPMLPQRETYAPDNALSRGQEIAVEVDEAQAVCLSLQPGEMSLHHIWIVPRLKREHVIDPAHRPGDPLRQPRSEAGQPRKASRAARARAGRSWPLRTDEPTDRRQSRSGRARGNRPPHSGEHHAGGEVAVATTLAK
jgi:hypothetical protein